MRLSGLAAGIATFAVLEITQNILGNWESIGPGPLTLSTVPQTTDLWQATVGAIAVACVAFGYQLSPLGRKLRATREDPFAAQAAGIDVHRQRLWAFTSPACWRLRRRALRALQGSLATDVALDYTFLTWRCCRRRRCAPPRYRRRRARRQRDRLVLSDAGPTPWLAAPPVTRNRRRGGVHGARADLHAAGGSPAGSRCTGCEADRRVRTPRRAEARRAAGRRSRRRRPVVRVFARRLPRRTSCV